MRRLLATAAPPGGVLAGKALAAFTLGTASMLVMWLATTVVFGADWGDPLAVVALTVSSVLSAIGITALVITLARTDEQAEGYSSLVVFTLALLGGNFIYLAQPRAAPAGPLSPTAGPCAASSTWSPTAAAWPRWPCRSPSP